MTPKDFWKTELARFGFKMTQVGSEITVWKGKIPVMQGDEKTVGLFMCGVVEGFLLGREKDS